MVTLEYIDETYSRLGRPKYMYTQYSIFVAMYIYIVKRNVSKNIQVTRGCQ